MIQLIPKISDELISKYLDGNATLEETHRILQAARHDSELREILAVAQDIPLKDTGRDTLPMMSLAAEDGECLCDMRCEQYILQRFGYGISLPRLIEEAKGVNILHDGGTPLHLIGKVSEAHGLITTRRYDTPLEDMMQMLDAGCSVIAVVNSSSLTDSTADDAYEPLPNHAVVVLSCQAEDNEVICLNPSAGEIPETYSIDKFLQAWQDSRNYMVTVSKDLKEYTPRPIDLDDVALTPEVVELREAIDENAHEVWAQTRMAEGWTYGPERNDLNKKHPDMVPYSMLSEGEKEYDRVMAFNTIKLLHKLGYSLVKN